MDIVAFWLLIVDVWVLVVGATKEKSMTPYIAGCGEEDASMTKVSNNHRSPLPRVLLMLTLAGNLLSYVSLTADTSFMLALA